MNRKLLTSIPVGEWIALGAAVVNIALLLAVDGIKVTYDTPSYEYAIGNIFAHSYDVMRTHGYPLLIALCRFVVGQEHAFAGVIAVQLIFFFISVHVLWRLLCKVTGSRNTATVFGVIYAVMPGFGNYATFIATESLTLSFLIFMLSASYTLLSPGNDERRTRRQAVIVFTVSLAVLLAMRPASQAVLGAVAVLIAAVFVQRRPCRYALVAGTALALLLPAYQFLRVTHALGIPTMSEVSLVNRYCILIKARPVLDPGITENPKVKELIIENNDNINNPYRNPYYEVKVFRAVCGGRALDSLLTAYGSPYIGFGDRLKEAVTDYKLLSGCSIYSDPTPYGTFISDKTFFAAVRYPIAFAGIILGCVILALQWRRDRRVPWFTIMLLASLSASVLTAILYGQDSYDRLSLPGVPALMLILAIPFGKEILLPPYPATNDKTHIK